MIELREKEKLQFNFIIQVDTLCHCLPNFIEKCARAGVKRVFIGLENINPDNLLGAKKQQNKITEYRLFYPRFLAELLVKQIKWARLYLRLYTIYSRLRKDPYRAEYVDAAITPVSDDEIETREMYQTESAKAYVVKIQRIKKSRRASAA
jgi:hypothetical protein